MPQIHAFSDPSPPPFPPPHSFDVLPALHELLARVDHSASAATPAAPSDSEPDFISARYAVTQPLDPKHLPSAVLPLKARIRKAVREVERMPDVHRSIAEQRAEIAALEARIERQQDMARRVAALGRELEGRLEGRG